MKKAVIVSANYYPYATSNCNCIEPLINKLIQQGWQIDIVTSRKDTECLKEEVIKNATVHRVDDYHTIIWNTYKKLNNIDAPKIIKKAIKISSVFLRACNHLYTKAKKYRYEVYCMGWDQSKVIKKLNQLHNENKYDLIMSVSYPFYPHIIVQEFLKQCTSKIPWIVYETDPFAYNTPSYGKNSYDKYIEIEKEVFSNCDKILLTPELYQFNQTTPLNKYMNKCICFPFPNMHPITYSKNIIESVPFDMERTNLIFGGALYPDIRNPEYLFKILGKTNSKIHFTVITSSKPDFWSESLKNMDEKVRFLPHKIRDTAYDAMLRSDILVNIGNTVTFQTPGKIFEYMAMGKPIIHFQKIENDPCLKYFENYPMVLIIDERENTPLEHAKIIEEFCEKYKGKSLTFDEVANYIPQYMSENVVAEFVSTVNKLLD